jgi:hypothetical protein
MAEFTANEMLLFIRNFLRQAPPEEMQKLWAVLTALRGPDFHHQYEQSFKIATTSVIRRALLGTKDNTGIPAIISEDSWDSRDLRKHLDEESAMGEVTGGSIPPHFVQHARHAFRTLGLDWYQYNDPKRHDDTVIVEYGPLAHRSFTGSPDGVISAAPKKARKKTAKKKK